MIPTVISNVYIWNGRKEDTHTHLYGWHGVGRLMEKLNYVGLALDMTAETDSVKLADVLLLVFV
jgi:hypothetical protein